MENEVNSKKGKKKGAFRAESLLRNASTNNARYIVNSDRKARIITIVNAGIISIIISLAGFQVPDEILPEIPKAILLITNVISLVFALKSVRSLHPAKEGNRQESKYLLDYAEHEGMTFDDYFNAMKEILTDDEKVLEYAIFDLYRQGKLLQEKHKHLKIAFLVFGLGMLMAIIAFFIIQFS